jgi:cell division protein FtsN
MSYDFTFNHKTFFALVFCLVALLLATFFAGFFTGILRIPRSQVISSKSSTPKLEKLVSTEKDAQTKPVAQNPATGTSEESPKPSAGQVKSAETADTKMNNIGKQEERQYCLQFGSFQEKSQADRQLNDLAAKGITAMEESREDSYQQNWFVVRMGAFQNFDEASQAADGLRSKLNQPVLVRPTDSL